MHILTAALILLAGFLLHFFLRKNPPAATTSPASPSTPPPSAEFRDLLEKTSRIEWPLELEGSMVQLSIERPVAPPKPRQQGLGARYRKYIVASPHY